MMGRFEEIGVPVRADETRTGAVCVSSAGESRVVIAAKGYALSVDPLTGTCRQLQFPGGWKGYPYGSISGPDGRFYTGANNRLLVLDPFRETVLWQGEPEPGEEVAGLAFAVDREGTVWLTTYPSCYLLRFDPVSMTCSRAVRLDIKEKYAYSLACGDDGWIYAGIGTERRQVVAYHREAGLLRHFLTEEERSVGSGLVYKGVDGEVYGRFADASEWVRLRNGEALAVADSERSEGTVRGEGFHRVYGRLPGHEAIHSVSLENRELILEHKLTSEQRILPLQYESEGANLSPMTLGPDGNLYGTSNHPLHFYRYNLRTEKLVSFGANAIERGGGGNICAYASQGPYLTGAAYAGGLFHVFDTRRPVEPSAVRERNPWLAAVHPEIHRPRCAMAHPDGRHVVYGGFPGYGYVGGGLGIYDVDSGKDVLIPNERLLPFHSTLCLAPLGNGNFIGGTSVKTHGGAEPKACEAELYEFGWTEHKVLRRWVPVPGTEEISLLTADRRGRLHGVTSDAIYFVCDHSEESVIHMKDLSAYGEIVRDGLMLREDGSLLILLSRGILRIETHNFEAELLGIPQPDRPITAGMAVAYGRIYYGSGPRLMRFVTEEGQEAEA